MSANASHRRARHAILRSPISDFTGWRLLVSCTPCDRSHLEVAVSGLGSGTIGDGIRRMRCCSCGGRPSAVLITNGGRGSRQRTVILEGSGAYGQDVEPALLQAGRLKSN